LQFSFASSALAEQIYQHALLQDHYSQWFVLDDQDRLFKQYYPNLSEIPIFCFEGQSRLDSHPCMILQVP
jgi:hypothetical protein